MKAHTHHIICNMCIFSNWYKFVFRKTEEETRSKSRSPDKCPDSNREIIREKTLSPERAPSDTREKSMSLESTRSRESRTRSIELEEDYVRMKDSIWRDWKDVKARTHNTPTFKRSACIIFW